MSDRPDNPREAFDLALQHHKAGRLDEAAALYRNILETSPHHAGAFHMLGLLAYQSGEAATAIEMIDKALHIEPNDSGAWYNLGNAFTAAGRWEEAVSAFRRAIDLTPNFIEAHNNLGNALREQGKPEEALACYRHAVSLLPEFAPAHNNLGKLLTDLGRLDEAIACSRQALSVIPNFPGAYNNLGIALAAQGKTQEAMASYRRAIAIDPNFAEPYYNLGTTLADLNRLDEAVSAYQRAIAIKPDFTSVHHNLAIAFGDQGKLDEAIACYRRVAEIDPDNSSARHMLAALTGETTESTPPEYVKNLFDLFSAKFEHQLVEVLEYDVPALIRQAFGDLLKKGVRFHNAIDLGCGTGLAGVQFRNIADRLTGIDISPQMVEKAREKGVYDELSVGNLIEFVSQTEEKFDLILATDVFVYMGNLQPVFASMAHCAADGAYFLFSNESIEEGDYILRPTGRYAHSRAYIRSLAERYGFSIEYCRSVDVRKEKDRGIPGDLFILAKTKQSNQTQS
ncbi:MAG: tetratricopeptide repeat protein [Nitrospinales bacterium]